MLVSDLINMTNQFLAEPGDSIVASLVDGVTENSYLITDTQQRILWINEAQNRLARLCIPIFSTANFAATSAGQPAIPYTNFVDASNRTLHRPVLIEIGSRNLNQANMGFLLSAAATTWYPTTPWGDPTGWADNGQQAVFSNYTTQPTFSASGYFLPIAVNAAGPPSGSSSSSSSSSGSALNYTTDPMLDDFSLRTVAYYVAWQICLKNQDNSRLAARLGPISGELVMGIKEMYSRMLENDNTLAGVFSAAPIDAMVQTIKTINVRT